MVQALMTVHHFMLYILILIELCVCVTTQGNEQHAWSCDLSNILAQRGLSVCLSVCWL